MAASRQRDYQIFVFAEPNAHHVTPSPNTVALVVQVSVVVHSSKYSTSNPRLLPLTPPPPPGPPFPPPALGGECDTTLRHCGAGGGGA